MFVFYDWPFPHMCTLQRIQPISLSIPGSVFSDCVVFYGDIHTVDKFADSVRQLPLTIRKSFPDSAVHLTHLTLSGSTLNTPFQAEDGIRDAQESRGLGDVYKRQVYFTASQQLEVIP